MPDLRHGSGPLVKPPGWTPPGAPNASANDQINGLIDAAMQARRAKQKPREYIGASELGDECLRRVWYSAMKAERKPFDGQKLRVFELGHTIETLMADWLKAAGFHLREHDRDGKQFEFVTGNGAIKGHSDGVIVGGPIVNGLIYPALWENKGLGLKYWNQIVKKGLRAYSSTYFAQCQLYMGYFKLTCCLFTAVNKNTAEVYHEIVPFELGEAQHYSDRGVELIKALQMGRVPPRICPEPDFFKARFCDYAGTVCFKGE